MILHVKLLNKKDFRKEFSDMDTSASNISFDIENIQCCSNYVFKCLTAGKHKRGESRLGHHRGTLPDSWVHKC